MSPIKISEKTKDRWALVNEADRQVMMLEFQYQAMQAARAIRAVFFFFGVLIILGFLLGKQTPL